jgi:UDP-N-acetylmuramoyl-L-alanyl-D-glutamate--2,6-diaminopimelate ligase
MEVSSHALEWHRVADVVFRAAVFTNLTQDHLDFHREMDAYFVAKRRLFKLLADAAPAANPAPAAVINTDDPYGRRIRDYLKSFPSVAVLTYGLAEPAEMTGRIGTLSVDGTSFTISVSGKSISTRCPLPGRHNVLNALSAAATLHGLSYPLEEICRWLPEIPPVPGRMETVRSGQPFLVVVDYAHTPDALRNLLDALRQITPGRIITVFGCGGDRDRSKRPKMGRVVSELSDITIVTSDNPRTEDPGDIIEEILPGIVSERSYEVVPDRRLAIRKAVSMALEGDTVVIAGKGHETYQIIGHTVLPFDDRREARQALAMLGFGQ